MFSKRLKILRARDNISQLKLAEILGFSQQAIAKWETEVATPAPDVIAKISNIFNVTTDYLLGRTDDPTPPGQNKKPVPEDELSEEEKTIGRLYRQADANAQKIIRTVLEPYEETMPVLMAARDGAGFEPVDKKTGKDLSDFRRKIAGQRSKAP